MNQIPAARGPARRARPGLVILYALVLAGATVWLAAVFLAPFLRSRSAGGAAGFLYALFAPLCHQIPARSFTFCGQPLAVCARCLGVYSGFLAGLIIHPFAGGLARLPVPSGRLFLLLSLPIGVDYAGGLLGAWASPKGIRFATGALWGSLLPFYLLAGLGELVLRRAARKKRPSGAADGSEAAGLANHGRKHVQ